MSIKLEVQLLLSGINTVSNWMPQNILGVRSPRLKFIPYKILQDNLARKCRLSSCNISQESHFMEFFLQEKHFSCKFLTWFPHPIISCKILSKLLLMQETEEDKKVNVESFHTLQKASCLEWMQKIRKCFGKGSADKKQEKSLIKHKVKFRERALENKKLSTGLNCTSAGRILINWLSFKASKWLVWK